MSHRNWSLRRVTLLTALPWKPFGQGVLQLVQVYPNTSVPGQRHLGFLQAHEKKLLDEVTVEYGKHWMPINWACALMQVSIASYLCLTAPTYQFKFFRTVYNVLKSELSAIKMRGNS